MRARRSGWALAVAALVVLAGACATEADDPLAGEPGGAREPGGAAEQAPPEQQPADFEATASYLDKVSDQSTGEAHRIEMSMAIRASAEGERLDIEAPLLTGEEEGGRFEMHMDMGQWIDEMAAGLGEPGAPPGLDLTMDMVGDEQTLYMRAPFFGALLAEAPPGTDLGPMEDLAVISDRWGRIDLTQLGGFSLGQVQGTMGGPAGSDPRVLLELVAGADSVEDVGSEQIDGTVVHGLAARLSMADLLEAQGMNPEDFVNQMAAGMGAAPGAGLDAEAAAERLLAHEVPFEVWVDGSGYVRRVSYEMDMAAMLGSGIDSGIGSGGVEEFVVGTTMDFSDYGDESIAIEFPTDAIDVTEAYREMLRASAAQAAGAAGDPQGS
jgi:hypothetical protein